MIQTDLHLWWETVTLPPHHEQALDEHTIRELACIQLSNFIRQDRYVEQCKAEWMLRWRLPWPKYKSASGMKEDE